MRLGILGGSFDPIHNGHLAIAQACEQQAALDEVWFMPTAVQPLKHRGPQATDAQRIEMLNLAIDSKSEPWRVCTLEIDRGGISYTVDTLRQIHEELPDAAIYFLFGSDALRDVARWKEPDTLFHLATPLVVHRAGDPKPGLTELAQLCTNETQPRLIEMPALDISSSEIRRCIVAGEPIDPFVPPAVADYIDRHKLYQST